MDTRKLACLFAAGIVGFGLVSTAGSAFAKPNAVVVLARPIDPALQRMVVYDDLNLALSPDQSVLDQRIWRTARRLCFDLNGHYHFRTCTTRAIHSTDDQVAAATDRAQRKMAGLSVGPAVAISMVIGAR